MTFRIGILAKHKSMDRMIARACDFISGRNWVRKVNSGLSGQIRLHPTKDKGFLQPILGEKSKNLPY